MAECEWLALVTFAKFTNWQDGQKGLARVATPSELSDVEPVVLHDEAFQPTSE